VTKAAHRYGILKGGGRGPERIGWSIRGGSLGLPCFGIAARHPFPLLQRRPKSLEERRKLGGRLVAPGEHSCSERDVDQRGELLDLVALVLPSPSYGRFIERVGKAIETIGETSEADTQAAVAERSRRWNFREKPLEV
jgi:hypothetical protein